MRILITGGFGYLGGRMASYLINKGHEITLVSRKYRDRPKWLPKAKAVKVDFFDLNSLNSVFTGVDLIIHAAAMNSSACFKDPYLAHKMNVVATENILLAAAKSKIKKFIFLSTIHVYSDILKGSFNEESPLLNNHPYARTKRYAEELIKKICTKNNIHFLILRLSNIVGPPAHIEVKTWDLFANQICLKILNKREFLINNPYDQRDFLSMETFLIFLEKIIKEKNSFKVINVCSSKSLKIIEFADIIMKIAKNDFFEDPKIIIKKSDKRVFDNNLIIKSNSSDLFHTNSLENEIRLIFNFLKNNFKK